MKKGLYKKFNNFKKGVRSFFLRYKFTRDPTRKIKDANELSSLMYDRAYLHDDEVPLMQKYSSKAKDTMVEIGSAFGGSPALLLSSKAQGTILHSIDPFIVDSMSKFQASKKRCKKNVVKVLSALNKKELLSDWVLHDDYSYNVIKKWSEPIDMIFIDGDHNYEAVKKDFEDWYPYVSKNGKILLHDSRKEEGTSRNTFNRGWAGPTELAKELEKDKRVKLIDQAFSITVWEKKY